MLDLAFAVWYPHAQLMQTAFLDVGIMDRLSRVYAHVHVGKRNNRGRKRRDNTCGKRTQIIARLGTCSLKRARCSQYGGTNVSSTPEREINRVVHSSLTTPNIEADIVKRALDTCCTAPQRKARTLRLPAEILALVEKKQRFLQRWRGARGLCEKEQLSRLYKSQTAVVKRAMRACKRRKLEDLAGEVEQAVSRGEARTTCAQVKRLAPVL